MSWKVKWKGCQTMCHLAKSHAFSHKVFAFKTLVKGSARLFALSTFPTATSPRATMSRIMWFFFSMCFFFSLWFLGLCNHSTIIAKQCDKNLPHSHNTKIMKEFLKPNNFLCCFTRSKIFSFHGGVGNTWLLNTPNLWLHLLRWTHNLKWTFWNQDLTINLNLYNQ